MSCLFPQEEEEEDGGIGRLFAAISSTNARPLSEEHLLSLAISTVWQSRPTKSSSLFSNEVDPLFLVVSIILLWIISTIYMFKCFEYKSNLWMLFHFEDCRGMLISWELSVAQMLFPSKFLSCSVEMIFGRIPTSRKVGCFSSNIPTSCLNNHNAWLF